MLTWAWTPLFVQVSWANKLFYSNTLLVKRVKWNQRCLLISIKQYSKANGVLVLQVFGHKSQYWTNWKFDLTMALDEKLRYNINNIENEKIITINVFIKFYCNPFNSCPDTSLKTTNVALQEGDHQ